MTEQTSHATTAFDYDSTLALALELRARVGKSERCCLVFLAGRVAV
jgi:hypothetical protein